MSISSGKASTTFGHANENFSVFTDRNKESISKGTNNDSDLNLHSITKLSSWLRYCLYQRIACDKCM